MAQALAKGLVESSLVDAEALSAADPSPDARQAFEAIAPAAFTGDDNAEVAKRSDVIFLAVKPQFLGEACELLAPALDGQLVVSIVAGATLYQLHLHLSTHRIVRVMPNTPCLVGAGAAGYSVGSEVSAEDRELVHQWLEAVGVAVQVPESQLDAVTGLSGSGPAYVFVLMEALADGGVRMGLPRAVALQLAAHTVRGAAELQIRTGEHPGILKDRVASPGGTTIAGLQALEDHSFRAAAMAAVEAATRRAEELGD